MTDLFTIGYEGALLADFISNLISNKIAGIEQSCVIRVHGYSPRFAMPLLASE